jgi:hypothetical protein
MLKINDPIGIVATSLSVSAPVGPEVVCTKVVMYDPDPAPPNVATALIVCNPEGPEIICTRVVTGSKFDRPRVTTWLIVCGPEAPEIVCSIVVTSPKFDGLGFLAELDGWGAIATSELDSGCDGLFGVGAAICVTGDTP